MPLRWLWQRRLWFACGMGFVALVIYLSLTPDPVRAPTWDDFKTGHVIAYSWLMLWFGQIWTSVARRLVVAGMLCALGIGLEYAQDLTGYRTFSHSDMWDDALGVAVGFALCFTPLGRIERALEQTASTKPDKP
jgi:hypothetical protein